MTQDNTIVWFCPECGSASLERSALTGGGAACKACTWTGYNHQLAGMPFRQELGDAGQITQALVGDLRGVLAKDGGTVFARFLQKWGFLDPEKPEAAKLLGRYLAAIARSTLTAILNERQAIEKERVDAS